jgi:hypothetical protein
LIASGVTMTLDPCLLAALGFFNNRRFVGSAKGVGTSPERMRQGGCPRAGVSLAAPCGCLVPGPSKPGLVPVCSEHSVPVRSPSTRGSLPQLSRRNC